MESGDWAVDSQSSVDSHSALCGFQDVSADREPNSSLDYRNAVVLVPPVACAGISSRNSYTIPFIVGLLYRFNLHCFIVDRIVVIMSSTPGRGAVHSRKSANRSCSV
eukprot:COSAG02_NODE_528_length_20698_cov_6.231710_18_plen_107_part_00